MSFQGATLLMMGTADELPQAPAQKPVFMEDMTEQQLASAVSHCSAVFISTSVGDETSNSGSGGFEHRTSSRPFHVKLRFRRNRNFMEVDQRAFR